jgi:hypothetical protein
MFLVFFALIVKLKIYLRKIYEIGGLGNLNFVDDLNLDPRT